MSIPWYRKLIYAALTTCVFFVALELVLWAVGVRPVTDTEDPFVGFSGVIPLYTPVEGRPDLLTTANSKAPWFNPQTFAKQKPDGVYRIVCLGGSTTYGRPFRDATSFCGWLREYLKQAEPKRRWEVINAGGVSYASYRVANVMEEMTQYDPDLFIVYTGQNEFLEWRTYDDLITQNQIGGPVLSRLSTTRTWALVDRMTRGLSSSEEAPAPERFQMPAEVDEMLNHTIGPTSYERDGEWRRNVLTHFRRNLVRMTQLAEQAEADILFVTPASNLKDCSPFRSDPTDGISDDDSRTVADLVDAASAFAAEGELEPAIEELLAATELDPQNARLHFELGKLYFRNGEDEAAQGAFQDALEEDVCPLRALEEQVTAVREVAQASGAMLVDFAQQLTAHSYEKYDHACFGSELFLDHVHPTIDGHRMLGEWIYARLHKQGVVKRALDDEIRAAAADNVRAELTREDQGVALRNLSKVLHWAGKFDEAGPLALQALDLLGDDFASLAVAADCLRETGRVDESVPYYEKALDLDPSFYQAYMRLGQVASRAGDYDAARQYLESGLLLEPEVAFAQYELGFVRFQLDEIKLAVEAFQKALELAPGDGDTLYFLGRAYRRLGQLEQAADHLRQAIESVPDDAQAHYELGIVLLEQQQPEAAVQAFDEALKLRPDFEEAAIRRDEASAK